MTAAVEVVRAADLIERLRRHYLKPGDFPGGVFVPEVGVNGAWASADGRSVGKARRCDALYVGFTSTSGRVLVGHEVKVSRADWLHELNSPGKADAWADQCHAWYVVAPADVVRLSELPPGWGLMTPGRTPTRMTVEVRAEIHDDRNPAWWAVRSLLARNDTLMHAAVEARADSKVKARIEGELRRARIVEAGVESRVDVMAREIAEAFRSHNLTDDHGDTHYVSADDVVATVRSLLADRAAASTLRWQLAALARDVRSVVDTLDSDALNSLLDRANAALEPNRKDTPT